MLTCKDEHLTQPFAYRVPLCAVRQNTQSANCLSQTQIQGVLFVYSEVSKRLHPLSPCLGKSPSGVVSKPESPMHTHTHTHVFTHPYTRTHPSALTHPYTSASTYSTSRECLGHHRKGTPGIGNVYKALNECRITVCL